MYFCLVFSKRCIESIGRIPCDQSEPSKDSYVPLSSAKSVEALMAK